MKECHGILDRHQLMLEACEINYVTEDDYLDLGRASLGSCLLSGLPDWVIAYSARMVRIFPFFLPSLICGSHFLTDNVVFVFHKGAVH